MAEQNLNGERFESLHAIDAELLRLLEQRMHFVFQMVRQSDATSLTESSDEAKQSEQAFTELIASSGLPSQLTLPWLRHAASICDRQSGLRAPIVFLGPIYSYSYLAAVKHFGLAADLVPVTTIAAAFDEIQRGQARFGVVPIENSSDGRVVDTLGMFARTPVQIFGEVLLPVHHCLLGRCSRAEVTVVQSKPQAISQCRGWLAQHVPDARLVEVASTAAAAALAAETPGAAAIASAEAGLHHGLRIIDENIEDNSNNITRFVIIGKVETVANSDKNVRRMMPGEAEAVASGDLQARVDAADFDAASAHAFGATADSDAGNSKTSLMFQLEHRPGALANAMVAFQQANVNLTWIESFPLPNRPSEYLFFVELEGHASQSNVAAAIDALRNQVPRLELLGSYPRGVAPSKV